MYKRKGVREQVFNGELLAKLRQEHGLSQEELADAINAGASQINRYERGLSEPSLAVLLRIKKVLGVTIDDMIDDPDRNMPPPNGVISARNNTERELIRAYRSGDLRELLTLLGKQ